MATQIRRLLVALGDLHHVPRNELRKAAAIAKASGASVELFHAITEPDPGRSYPETATAASVRKSRTATATKHQYRLQQLSRDPALRGVKVICTASWDYPPHEAIIRRAHAIRADWVIAATRRHRFGARIVLTNTDWELIRHCPVPVLLVKSRHPYRKPVVLAAVDPFHAHARPTDLDARLLQAGNLIAKLLRGNLHVVHAYMPLPSVELMPGAPPVMLPPEAETAHEKLIRRVVIDLAENAGVSEARCHIGMGGVAVQLDAAARVSRASLVVMGAVSRSALARMFVGNAAERVLDRLGCDVLVVKPRGFKSGVLQRRALAVTGAAAHEPVSARRQRAR